MDLESTETVPLWNVPDVFGMIGLRDRESHSAGKGRAQYSSAYSGQPRSGSELP